MKELEYADIKGKKDLFLTCECECMDHLLALTYFPPHRSTDPKTKKKEDFYWPRELNLTIYIPGFSLRERIKCAFLHIFRPKDNYWETWMFGRKKAKEIHDFIGSCGILDEPIKDKENE